MLTYNKYIFFFALLSLLSNHISPTYAERCVEVPLFGSQQLKDCPTVKSTELDFKGKSKSALVDGDSSMIKINFTCDQAKTPDLCNKADIAFKNAAKIVENTFELKAQIVIDAKFVQLCGTLLNCAPGKQPLGAAGPQRLIPLTDDDGAVRLYPQSLVKQFQLPEHPEFSPVDIVAGFNSNSSTFWFRGDPPIRPEQVDFEVVLIHEYLHGLGFVTSWDDYFNLNNPKSLTPFPSFNIGEDFSKQQGAFNFTGFQEYALDKYLVFTKDNSSLSQVTKRINQFTSSSTQFTSEKEFLNAFVKSPQYKETLDMFSNSITRGSIAFRLPDDGDNCVMETSLVPYQPGSTFSHLDFNTFSDTTDFLMRFKAPRNAILDNIGDMNGKHPENPNPIGQKTIRILKALGYAAKPNADTFKLVNTEPEPQPKSPKALNNVNKDTSEHEMSTANRAETSLLLLSSLLSSFIISTLF